MCCTAVGPTSAEYILGLLTKWTSTSRIRASRQICLRCRDGGGEELSDRSVGALLPAPNSGEGGIKAGQKRNTVTSPTVDYELPGEPRGRFGRGDGI